MTQALHHIAAMSPYALADMSAPDGMELVSLSQNECLRPPSPKVVQAAIDSLSHSADYPDPDWIALRSALADLHGISAASILCGAGSLDLIGCLARAFAGPGASVLAPEHAYPFFKTAAQMADARFDTAAECAGVVDVDEILQAVQPDTAIVFVANPGNPTGTHISKSELNRLRAGLRDSVLLVIDEAYGEFTDAKSARCWDMVEGGNCVILRTFSKAYAMAGFRIGWGLFPPAIAGEVRKVMNPNSVTLASQAAALAAVQDQTFMQETCTITADLRQEAAQALIHTGYDVLPSVTNFLLISFESEAMAISTDNTLRSKGIFLRRQHGARLPHALRMTIGPKAATDAAITRLIAWKQECLS